MKKKIGLLAMSALMIAALASCSGSKTRKDISVTDGEVPTVVSSEDSSGIVERYSGFTIDTTNVRKEFYLGETFSSNGLKVEKSYLKYYKTGGQVEGQSAVKYETKDYSVDSSNVNMNVVGKYPVIVTCRVGSDTQTKRYDVEVKSSLFESTEGSFISGIRLKINKDSLTSDLKGFIDQQNDGYSLEDNAILTVNKKYNLTFSEDNLTYEVHKTTVEKVEGKLVSTDSVVPDTDIDSSKFTIDATSWNTDENGDYVVTATYNAGKVTIKGVEYDNIVSSYIIISVVNPAKKIEIIGDSEFDANVNGVDFSSWKVKITRVVDEPQTIDFSDELFTVKNLDNFKWNQLQTVTVILKENTKVSINKSIYINESSTQNIEAIVDIKQTSDAADADGYVKVGDTNYIFVKDTVKFDDRTDKIDNVESGTTYTTDSVGALKFYTRVTIKGVDQAFKVVMDKTGQIVVFFATPGVDAKDLEMRNEAGEVLDATSTPAEIRRCVKYTFEIKEPGTYYFVNPTGGLYVHGFVVAKNKK